MNFNPKEPMHQGPGVIAILLGACLFSVLICILAIMVYARGVPQ